MKQTLTARAIIKQEQKVLLLRRTGGNPLYAGLFELPGGKINFGEDPKASLQREVFEETGREIETLQIVDVLSDVDTRDPMHQYIVLTFLATLRAGTTIELSQEHDKYVWKKLSEIQLNEVTETTRRVLEIEGDTKNTDSNIAATPINDGNITSKSEVIVYSDGGSRGNPGPSASGFVILDEKENLLVEGGKYLGITTNNQAEYQAVRIALEKALEIGATIVRFRLDSQLVANQLNGVYQIKNRDLWPIHSAIKELQTKFKQVTFTHVRREFNKQADAVVNKILDEHS